MYVRMYGRAVVDGQRGGRTVVSTSHGPGPSSPCRGGALMSHVRLESVSAFAAACFRSVSRCLCSAHLSPGLVYLSEETLAAPLQDP